MAQENDAVSTARDFKKLRVLMIVRTMEAGGTEKVVLQLCEHFSREFGYLAVASCGGYHEARLSELGVEHFKIGDIADSSPLNQLCIMRDLKKIVEAKRINLIHSHHRAAALLANILFGSVTRVVTAHNVFTNRKLLTRLAYKDCDVVACGPRVKDNLRDFYGLRERRVVLIPNSVSDWDGRRKPVKEIAEIGEEYFKVGFLGRYSESKGVKYLISAIVQLTNNGMPISCFLAGEGEDEGELRAMVESSGCPDRFTFLGRREDAQNYVAQLDVCVMPSLYEGLPLVLLEAFSVGTPVVAAGVDGIKDVVEDGVDGLLVSPRDSSGLARAIWRLYKDEGYRQSIGIAARAKYVKDYSYDSWVAQYRSFYARVDN